MISEDVKSKKLRVISNASAIVNDVCTFNDLPLARPKLQAELPEILTRYRLNEIRITIDDTPRNPRTSRERYDEKVA